MRSNLDPVYFVTFEVVPMFVRLSIPISVLLTELKQLVSCGQDELNLFLATSNIRIEDVSMFLLIVSFT